MAIYKRCCRCHELYEGKRCPKCSRQLAVAKSKRAKVKNETKKVYDTYLWQQCRKNIRIKYLDYDIWLMAEGQLHRCQHPVIHHIAERDDRPDLLFNLDNLITVSRESHEEIHRWYKEDKEKALTRIQRGINEFRRLFNDD
jgi:hypothetical protein